MSNMFNNNGKKTAHRRVLKNIPSSSSVINVFRTVKNSITSIFKKSSSYIFSTKISNHRTANGDNVVSRRGEYEGVLEFGDKVAPRRDEHDGVTTEVNVASRRDENVNEMPADKYASRRSENVNEMPADKYASRRSENVNEVPADKYASRRSVNEVCR